MNTRTAPAVLILIMFATISVQAGVIPGVWAKVEVIPEGYPVVIKLQGGEKLRGSFGSCGPDEITVRDETDTERTIPRSHIVTITSKHKTTNDSLAQGAIIGAAVGALASIPLAIYASSEGSAGGVPFAVLFCTGIGAGVGVATDAVIKGPEVFYQAPKQ
jgi:hypothetical protein